MCDMAGTCMNLFRKFSVELRIASAEGAVGEFSNKGGQRPFLLMGTGIVPHWE